MSAKILVIEDNPDTIAFLEAFLEDNGYTVCSARNGDEGLQLARKEKPDVITLDLLIPDKTGFKVYRELRTDADLKTTPVIVITGFASPEFPRLHLERFFYEGRAVPQPEGFLEKPVDEEELLATLQKCIGETHGAPATIH